MKATIRNYRRGRRTQTPNQALLAFPGVDSRAQAAGLQGTRVLFRTDGGKEIPGKVTQPHGNKGIVRARFAKGLPGTAIGTMIDVRPQAAAKRAAAPAKKK